MKNSWLNIFAFSKSERIGIIVLCVLIVAFIAASQLIYVVKQPIKIEYTQFKTALNAKQENIVATSTNATAATTIANKPNAKPQDKVIELNSADSTALLTLNGIGPVFAGRIVKYRNLLGGFVSTDQLLEVYGFNAETYDLVKPYITVKPNPRKINLNDADFKTVNKHPYIDYELTKAIFNLKKKLGTFKAVDDIKQIDLVTTELYNKLVPYLTVE